MITSLYLTFFKISNLSYIVYKLVFPISERLLTLLNKAVSFPISERP